MTNRKSRLSLHVHGMHCHACALDVGGTLKEAPGVTGARVAYAGKAVDIEGDFDADDAAALAGEFTKLVAERGYRLSMEKEQREAKWHEFKLAVPIAIAFVALFALLQKAGLLDLVGGDRVGPATAFLVGLVASVSSCLAVVGGLILSASAGFAKAGGAAKGATLFHLGRIGGFFILGGAIGLAGSAFQLGPVGFLILTVIVGLAMIAVGVNLLDVFHHARRFQFALPRAWSSRLIGAAGGVGALAPIALGAATFFLPCGFTQSMQLAALSSGSALSGALIMLFFALGTFPMLALLSFSAFRFADKPYAGVFFKAAGLVVILLALFNVANALAGAGIIAPLFSL